MKRSSLTTILALIPLICGFCAIFYGVQVYAQSRSKFSKISKGLPTDNPVATRYGADAYPWTDHINWANVKNVTDFPGDTDTQRYLAARDAAESEGGGVVYFPAGTYTFDDDLYLTNGVVIRGETPKQGDAKIDGYAPPTRFEFPQYVPNFEGEGTPNSTAFKKIRTIHPDADSNIGIVNLDINRAGITLTSNPTTGTNQNIIIFGTRTNNVAEPDPGVPNASQHAWQRFSYRFAANIRVQALANVLVANNRLNDFSQVGTDDSYDQPDYLFNRNISGTPVYVPIISGSLARFDYANHYGIYVNRSGSYTLPGTPESAPFFFRTGISIRDNWVYKTMRVGIHASGWGLEILNNVTRDRSDKDNALDPGGMRQAQNAATLENRSIDWSGYDVVVDGNDYEVYRHRFVNGVTGIPTGYFSVDGEGILIQECCGGTLVNGAAITNNTGNAYIGLYKVQTINGNTTKHVYIAGNTISGFSTQLGGTLIYVSASTNTTAYAVNNVHIEGNTLPGSILLTGNGGQGTGNNITANTNPNSNGIINHSCAASVEIVDNVGFTVNPCQ